MKREEQNTQIQVVRFLDRPLVPPAFVFHVPNGGKRTPAEARILKAMGVKSGVPDLFVVAPDRTFVAIEMKAKAGSAEKAQKERMAALRECGVCTAICRTLEEVEAAVLGAGVRLRARVAA
ncbi:hypothetical protein FHS78_000645 [Parvibaculum indicum]|uniref:VRR-NUC domain-containing protein n=1 Tax=Parvibaculum indicum TaxID=562969 RepID=UPI00141FAD86|nr:VRR-NUC domain-containing protein [Parvibaculum indicum]NIJ40375.1 hypothetical protein [Parvibaculum indicum]